VVALAPHEFPKLYEADLFHLHARVGLDAPQKVRAAPRSQVMAASGVPEKADLLHVAIIPATKRLRLRQLSGNSAC